MKKNKFKRNNIPGFNQLKNLRFNSQIKTINKWLKKKEKINC